MRRGDEHRQGEKLATLDGAQAERQNVGNGMVETE
jgi:hypothetical protein